MTRLLLTAASLMGMLAVILGAFGAHALKDKLSESLMLSYQTAVQYQFIHALALLLIGILSQQFPANRLFGISGITLLSGILLFSGSLYILALTGFRQLGPIPFGLVTPLGGLILILGWLLLIIASIKL
jgi:uncharacterized membrane protein YgdD (TMEM256/DUF423 family)